VYKRQPGFNLDIVEAADALGDMDYINEGTRLTYGIPRQAVANEIARSNLAKVGGTVDANGKLQKPEGWTPPDIAGVLARYR
jgi:predicted HAD superfamily Cof-like phosphohydrolase